MTSDDNFEQSEAKLRASLRQQVKRAIALRSKDREFHGLEREFLYHQAQMLSDYEESKDIKHPRDLGNVRESILRKFLQDSGYLPKRYSVSSRSIRVVSTTGHLSNEIDIAIYDSMDSLTLMKRQDVYEVYPIESVYGVIQVKSNLTKKELESGLQNLKSFKKLDRPSKNQLMFFTGRPPSQRGFSILFAYDSKMKWLDIINELKSFAEATPPQFWPNAVYVLNRGFFLFGDDGKTVYFNEDMKEIKKVQMHGFPDRQGICLYQFQSQLLTLLRHTAIQPANLDAYFQLPLVAEERSYNFALGMFSEVAHCQQHGDFARKLSSEALNTIVTWCNQAEPINWIKATNIAYGLPDDEEAYRHQPGDVRVYNPEGLPLSQVLLRDTAFGGETVRSLSFDMIDTAGIKIYLPYYYAVKENLISDCPKCLKKLKPGRRTTKAKKS